MKIISILFILLLVTSCTEEKKSNHHGMSDEEWNMKTPEEIKHSIKIELYGQQFHWTAHYAGADNEFPKFDYKLIQPENDLGIMTAQTIDSSILRISNKIVEIERRIRQLAIEGKDIYKMKEEEELAIKSWRISRALETYKKKHDNSLDKFALDDFLIKDTLYLVKDLEHEFSVRAKDVIHSAYFPHFRAQMNAVPGMTTRFKYTPAFTTEEMRIKKHDPKFNYVLMCNKICGKGHYKMKMPIKVVEREEFRVWVKSNKKNLLKNNPYFN
ncbi:MAG: cytochrome c oxidase subunit 2 [Crocinitomicaceae bacterium]|jgi:cytochrome c oxidase subunit 2